VEAPGVEPARRMTRKPSAAPTCTVIARSWWFGTRRERSVGNRCDSVNPVRLGDRWATRVAITSEREIRVRTT